jgi:glycosyltransferase involved in cell wall biosynthesis
MPQDPASGAARSVRTICELLARSGFTVHALGTTATERESKSDPVEYLKQIGASVKVEPGRSGVHVRPELRFHHRGVSYHLLHVGSRQLYGWQTLHGRQFDILFDQALHDFKPDLLFTYGGLPADIKRHQRARRQGVRIVFALRNDRYLTPGFFDEMAGVLTPSQFLTDFYRQAIGLESTPLPLPIEIDDVVAEEREPIFFTMINPSHEKGLMVVARLAEELGRRRPDIPMLIIESRGSAGRLIQAGLAGGFDLGRHENLMTSPPVPQPRDIYMPARALLVPSLWQEAAGRVVPEALLNGVPPIVSDRGGLGECLNGAGFIVPVPADVTPQANCPVSAGVVEPWLELIFRLEDDPEFYRQESERALQASKMYSPEILSPRYVDYFLDVLTR